MPREIPDCPNKPKPNVETGRSYEIELVMPMLGGGVESNANVPGVPCLPCLALARLQNS